MLFCCYCVVLLLFVLFCCYLLFVCKCVLYHCHRVFTQLQLTDIANIKYDRWRLDYKGSRRKGAWSYRYALPTFAWRVWRKPGHTPWMAGVPAGIQTEDLPNKALQCYCYPCLWPVPDVFQLEIHCAELQSCFVCVWEHTVIFRSVVCGYSCA